AEPKILSRQGALTLRLEPAPKLILKLRGWFPQAWIAGWKYEVAGTREQALARGQRQLREARTDWCVVNGAAYGPGYGVCDKTGWLVYLEDAQARGRWLDTRMRTRRAA